MKIKEILIDNQLYDMWLSVREAMVDNYSANDDYEGYPVRIRMAVKPIRREPSQRPPKKLTRKTVKAPAKPVKKSMVSNSQTIGLNTKIDPMNGPDFKLDDRNVLPKFEKNLGISDK